MKQHLTLLTIGLILGAIASHGQIIDTMDAGPDTGWVKIEGRGWFASDEGGLTPTAGTDYFLGNTQQIIGLTKEFPSPYVFDAPYTVTFDVGNPNLSPLGTPSAFFMVDVNDDGYEWTDVIQGGGRVLAGNSPASGTWEPWTLTQTFTDGMTTVGGYAISETDNITIALFFNPPGSSWAERESTAFDNLVISGPVAAPKWVGFEVDELGNVDTGSWLGYLNVAEGDWVWSYSLNTWIYLPEDHVMESGTWSYVAQ